RPVAPPAKAPPDWFFSVRLQALLMLGVLATCIPAGQPGETSVNTVPVSAMALGLWIVNVMVTGVPVTVVGLEKDLTMLAGPVMLNVAEAGEPAPPLSEVMAVVVFTKSLSTPAASAALLVLTGTLKMQVVLAGIFASLRWMPTPPGCCDASRTGQAAPTWVGLPVERMAGWPLAAGGNGSVNSTFTRSVVGLVLMIVNFKVLVPLFNGIDTGLNSF